MTVTDIQAILRSMTLLEKAALCIGASFWTTTSIDRVRVPTISITDGPNGVRKRLHDNVIISQSLPATCFPTASCLASTWDRELMYVMGRALAEEAIAQNVDVLLGPAVNMKRSPLCGRNFEYYSEDPYLAGEMAASLINGIQDKGVGTSLKHFAANNQEFKRYTISSEIDERTLREIYLPAFEMAVKKAKPWAVMCAYNQFNGTPCSENRKLLKEILKDEWNFDGLVMSDWGAVQNRVRALIAGLDLEMPGPRPRNVRTVIEAVRSGELDEATLDQSVLRILSVIFKATQRSKGGEFNVEDHHALASRIASEGMVLLKNNGILPLKDHNRFAIIGLSAKQSRLQGGGSSLVNPTRISVPFEELQQLAPNALFTYSDGYSFEDFHRQELVDEAVRQARSAEVAIIFLALPPSSESEGYDRSNIDLPDQQVTLIQSVSFVQPNTIVVINNGAPVEMSKWIDSAAAVLEAWLMGQGGGKAIAEILFGRTNPSGKLAETFPLKLSDTPAYLDWHGEDNVVRYGEGLFIGYRYYDAKETPVLFPFGHGLSYTSFTYSNPQTSSTVFKDTEGIDVSVDITNNGKLVGKEIVQFYVHDQKSSLTRPFKELKGFAKVRLQPGETSTVLAHLDFRSFAYYDPSYKRWVAENGDFDILIGSSSVDIRCKKTVTLASGFDEQRVLSRNSTIREWIEDPGSRVASDPMFRMVIEKIQTMLGSEENGRQSVVKDAMNSVLDTPIYMVLNSLEGSMTVAAEEVMTYLLEKIK
jgi:beta-glucosidase